MVRLVSWCFVVLLFCLYRFFGDKSNMAITCLSLDIVTIFQENAFCWFAIMSSSSQWQWCVIFWILSFIWYPISFIECGCSFSLLQSGSSWVSFVLPFQWMRGKSALNDLCLTDIWVQPNKFLILNVFKTSSQSYPV